MTWLWVGCVTAGAFSIALLLARGDGVTAVATGAVAGVITFAVRRPRRTASWVGWLFDRRHEEDESGWDRMRQREIVRRRRAAARDAAALATPDAATPAGSRARGRRRFPRWRRKYPPERSDAGGFFG